VVVGTGVGADRMVVGTGVGAGTDVCVWTGTGVDAGVVIGTNVDVCVGLSKTTLLTTCRGTVTVIVAPRRFPQLHIYSI
jgi:hypothetical protein